MGITNIDKNKVVNFCDKIQGFFLYILIFCLPFSNAIIEISATFVIFAWIIKRIFSYQFSLREANLLNFIKVFKPVYTYLNIPIFIYILATFLSVIFSTNFALSVKNFCTKTMEYIILYFIIVEFVRDKRRLENIIIIMLASAVMIGLDCVFQYFFGFDFLRFRQLEAGRITGSFRMPGDLAAFLGPVLCIPLSLGFLRLKKRIKYFLWITSVLLLSLLIATLTRGAWLGFIIAVCFLGFLENKKVIFVTLIFLLILGFGVSHLMETPINILERLKSIFIFTDASTLDRRQIWQIALRMLKDRPLFGQGFSTFMGNFAKYGQDYPHLKEGILPYAHNCYLQIAAETGLVGLFSFLFLIGTFFIHTIFFLKKLKDKFTHAALAGISAGIIATLFHSALDTNLYSLHLAVLFWFMLGLNAALQNFTIEEAGN